MFFFSICAQLLAPQSTSFDKWECDEKFSREKFFRVP